MKIGFPTYPRNSMVDEIYWIGKNGFDFADLFFEADKAEAHQIDPAGVRNALTESLQTLSAFASYQDTEKLL